MRTSFPINGAMSDEGLWLKLQLEQAGQAGQAGQAIKSCNILRAL
jgi:hypothetical protein